MLERCEELLSVVFRDDLSLIEIDTEQFAFFVLGKSLEVINTGLHFLLKQRQQSIILILHSTGSNTLKSRLERLFRNFLSLGCVLECVGNFLERTASQLSEVVTQVQVLEVLHLAQH